jgi:uncharacterized protein YdeI (BOF family)
LHAAYNPAIKGLLLRPVSGQSYGQGRSTGHFGRAVEKLLAWQRALTRNLTGLLDNTDNDRVIQNILELVRDYFDASNVSFDRNGYVTSFEIEISDGGGGYVPVEFTCTYTADKRIQKIAGSVLTIDFTYGSHNNYVEVGKDIFENLELTPFYIFQPRFLRGLNSIVLTTGGESTIFNFSFSGNSLTVNKVGATGVWSVADYQNGFPLQRMFGYWGTSSASGEYMGIITEDFVIDPVTGKIATVTDTEERRYDNTEIAPTTHVVVYTYLDDKYNNIWKEGSSIVYTYDPYGEWDLITSPNSTDQYSYTRDVTGNWTRHLDQAVFMGQNYNYDDRRTVQYYE